MYCFSASFCFLCLKHYPKKELLDINKHEIRNTKIVDVLHFCGFETNYCDDSYQVYICEKCVKRVEPFYGFSRKCSKNFATLKGYVTQMKSNANVAFHANLKVVLTDPKHGDTEPTIEYMDVNQFVETQIQADETDEAAKPPETINVISPENLNAQVSNIEQNEMSKFIYENHFLNLQYNYEEVIEVASSPDSFTDIPQNSSGSFNDNDAHSPTRNNCSICNKLCTTPTQLSVHEFLHTLLTYPDNEASNCMRYYCALCFLDLIGLAQIKRHLVSHTFDQLSTCKCCKQDFISNNDLNKHYTQNPSHKPHACTICYSRFATKRKLNAHTKRKHVLTCMFCKGSFGTKGELKAHMAAKHNNEFCYICPMSFQSNELLKKHLFHNHFELQAVGSDGSLKYKCPRCRAEFLTKYSLNEHLGGCGTE